MQCSVASLERHETTTFRYYIYSKIDLSLYCPGGVPTAVSQRTFVRVIVINLMMRTSLKSN